MPHDARSPKARRPAAVETLAAASLAAFIASSALAQATGSGVSEENRQRFEQLRERLDAGSLVPPSRIAGFGYRPDWQVNVVRSPGSMLVDGFATDEALFVHDSNNLLTRIGLVRGDSIWQTPVGDATDEVLEVFRVKDQGRDDVMIVGRLAIHVVSWPSGAAEARQRVERTLYTPGTLFGPYLIYGSRDGQVIWHQYEVGYPWRGHSLPGSVTAEPLLVGDLVYAVGSEGRVLALDAASTRLVWEKQLVTGIDARPASADGLLFVAGRDQYLWAFDATNGRTVWRYFTESPLVDAPVVAGNAVYQWVPTEGLVKLSIRPTDRIDGEVLWRQTEANGEIVAVHADRLLVWDAKTRTLKFVDTATGAIVDRLELPRVRSIVTEGFDSPAMAFISEDGTVMRIVPQG